MANRFYTIMIVPEKTSRVRKFVVPSWLMRGTAIGFAFTSLVAIVMVFDYWYVMNQISENKALKLENRRLRQQVQVFKNKMATVESTMERVKTFATRLKVITDYNTEDRGALLQSLNSQKIPDASANRGIMIAASATQPLAGSPELLTSAEVGDGTQSPEDAQLRKEYEALDSRFTEVNKDALFVEQMLQDQYELLADQKTFLAALPVRKPAIGYFTSGFGVRKSPVSDRIKMHEGLDIANRPGTPIRAPADGEVVFADTKAGYGQTLIIAHGYGLETWYGHTRKILVSRGTRVHRGQQVALIGNSGRSTGPHLHYEVRVHGIPVDPRTYLLEETQN